MYIQIKTEIATGTQADETKSHAIASLNLKIKGTGNFVFIFVEVRLYLLHVLFTFAHEGYQCSCKLADLQWKWSIFVSVLLFAHFRIYWDLDIQTNAVIKERAPFNYLPPHPEIELQRAQLTTKLRQHYHELCYQREGRHTHHLKAHLRLSRSL